MQKIYSIPFLKTGMIILFIFIIGAGIAPSGTVLAEESFRFKEITVEELLEGYEAGNYTTTEVVKAYLGQIAEYENFYNAFTVLNPDVLEAAEEIDERRRKGAEIGPLAGVPVVVKAAVNMAHFPATFGWAPLSPEAGGIQLMPAEDAPVV